MTVPEETLKKEREDAEWVRSHLGSETMDGISAVNINVGRLRVIEVAESLSAQLTSVRADNERLRKELGDVGRWVAANTGTHISDADYAAIVPRIERILEESALAASAAPGEDA